MTHQWRTVQHLEVRLISLDLKVKGSLNGHEVGSLEQIFFFENCLTRKSTRDIVASTHYFSSWLDVVAELSPTWSPPLSLSVLIEPFRMSTVNLLAWWLWTSSNYKSLPFLNCAWHGLLLYGTGVQTTPEYYICSYLELRSRYKVAVLEATGSIWPA